MVQDDGTADAAASGGAIPPPPGVVPNLDSPRDSGERGLNYAVQASAAVLVIAFFAVRSFAKWSVSPKIRAEDWFCSIACIISLMFIGSIFAMHHYGDGYHAWDLSPEAFRYYKAWLYVSVVLYCPAAYLTKVTLLLLIARVFAVKERVARGIYMFIVAITMLYTPLQVVKLLICVPIPSFWDSRIQQDFCFDSRKVFIADLALAIFTDSVILILPLTLAWPLRLGLWKKLKIAILLGAGGGAVGSDIFRMYKLVEIAYEQDVSGRFTIMTLLALLVEKCVHSNLSANTPRTQTPGWRARVASSLSTGRISGVSALPSGWGPLPPPTAAAAGRRPGSPDEMFSVGAECALMTSRPLSRIANTGRGGESAPAESKRPRD